MGKRIAFLLPVIFISLTGPLWALDPVAPREERAYGFLKVDTPLPLSDQCEISAVAPASGYTQSFKPGQRIKVPGGDYLLKAELQYRDWKNNISVRATELTALVLPGFGNLKVTSPKKTDVVEVYTPKGNLVSIFPASQVKTLPVGRYHVRVIMGDLETPKIQVAIITNTTREVTASEKKGRKIVSSSPPGKPKNSP